jgi:hypothetical protein
MTAATFHTPTAFPESRSASTRGLLASIFDAIIEARMRRAAREIAYRRHLLSEDMLKKYGYTATLTNDSAYPFTR